jgi:hypothetical protein
MSFICRIRAGMRKIECLLRLSFATVDMKKIEEGGGEVGGGFVRLIDVTQKGMSSVRSKVSGELFVYITTPPLSFLT